MCRLDNNSHSSTSKQQSRSSSNDNNDNNEAPVVSSEDPTGSFLRKRHFLTTQSRNASSPKAMEPQQQKQTPRSAANSTSTPLFTPFTIGGLRIFELHGMLGTLSFCLSFASLLTKPTKTHPILILAAMLSSSIVAIHSNTLLEQVPMQTTICIRPMRTVAPHRDAFKRTSIILLYVNARIFARLLSLTMVNHSTTTTLVGWMGISLACLRMFWPWASLDLTNGNTFCFVLPMMISVLGDYLMAATTMVLTITTSSSSSSRSSAMRKEDADAAALFDLWILQIVQLSGLVIAFLFTMAFRKILSVNTLYWTATVAVNLLAIVALSRVGLFFGSLLTFEEED